MDVNSLEPRQLCTPLHYAVRHSRPDCIRLLLEAGADTAIISKDQNSSALSLAMRNYDAEAVKLILSHGTKHGASVVNRDWALATPLHIAAVDGDLASVSELLRSGQSPCTVGRSGFTPLHLASRFGHAGVVKALLAAGASPQCANDWKYTPLHFAAMRDAGAGGAQVCEALLGRMSDVNLRDNERHTPLAHALYLKHEPQLIRLLAAGADPTLPDWVGASLLHTCALEGDDVAMRCADALLQHGAEVDQCDGQMETPFDYAVAEQKLGMAAFLLQRGADMFARSTERTRQGWQALSDAAKWGPMRAAARTLLTQQLGVETRKLAALRDGSAYLATREAARTRGAAAEAALRFSQLAGPSQLAALQDCTLKMAALRACAPLVPPAVGGGSAPLPDAPRGQRRVSVQQQQQPALLAEALRARAALAGVWVEFAQAAASHSDARLASLQPSAAVMQDLNEAERRVNILQKCLDGSAGPA